MSYVGSTSTAVARRSGNSPTTTGMLPALGDLTSFFNTASNAATNPVGTAVGGVLSIFGAKPDLRPQREDEMFSMVQNGEPYALEAARVIWWRHSNPGSKADAAENAKNWAMVQMNFPALAAQAQKLGPLTDDSAGSPNIPRSGMYHPSNTSPAQKAQNTMNPGTGIAALGLSTPVILAVAGLGAILLLKRK